MRDPNPYLGMWSQPRSSLRKILQTNPSRGVFPLSFLYVVQSLFYFANWWSAGSHPHGVALFAMAVLLSPAFAVFWIYYTGWIFRLFGKALGGSAPASSLRACIAWSKIPYTLACLMWLIFFFTSPDTVFILDAAEPSSTFVNLIYTILAIGSFVLLIQCLKEAQSFSVGRSIALAILSETVSFIIFLLVFMFVRFAITVVY